MKRAHLLQLSLHMRIMFASCSLLAVGWTSVERAWRIGGVSLTRKTSHVDNAVLRGGTGEQRARSRAALHAQKRAGASADCGSNTAARHAHWALAATARTRKRTVAAAVVLFPLLQRAREPAEKLAAS